MREFESGRGEGSATATLEADVVVEPETDEELNFDHDTDAEGTFEANERPARRVEESELASSTELPPPPAPIIFFEEDGRFYTEDYGGKKIPLEEELQEPWASAVMEMLQSGKTEMRKDTPDQDKDGKKAWIQARVSEQEEGNKLLEMAAGLAEPPAEDGSFTTEVRKAKDGYERLDKTLQGENGETGVWVPYEKGFEGELLAAYQEMIASGGNSYRERCPSEDTDEEDCYFEYTFTDDKVISKRVMIKKEKAEPELEETDSESDGTADFGGDGQDATVPVIGDVSDHNSSLLAAYGNPNGGEAPAVFTTPDVVKIDPVSPAQSAPVPTGTRAKTPEQTTQPPAQETHSVAEEYYAKRIEQASDGADAPTEVAEAAPAAKPTQRSTVSPNIAPTNAGSATTASVAGPELQPATVAPHEDVELLVPTAYTEIGSPTETAPAAVDSTATAAGPTNERQPIHSDTPEQGGGEVGSVTRPEDAPDTPAPSGPDGGGGLALETPAQAPAKITETAPRAQVQTPTQAPVARVATPEQSVQTARPEIAPAVAPVTVEQRPVEIAQVQPAEVTRPETSTVHEAPTIAVAAETSVAPATETTSTASMEKTSPELITETSTVAENSIDALATETPAVAPAAEAVTRFVVKTEAPISSETNNQTVAETAAGAEIRSNDTPNSSYEQPAEQPALTHDAPAAPDTAVSDWLADFGGATTTTPGHAEAAASASILRPAAPELTFAPSSNPAATQEGDDELAITFDAPEPAAATARRTARAYAHTGASA